MADDWVAFVAEFVKFQSFAQTFCANSNCRTRLAQITNAAMPRSLASRGLLAERFYGRCFVVLHIEDGVELRDLEKVVDLLGQVQQFEFASLFFGSGESTDKLADTRAVDIVHVAQVQQDSFLPLGKQVSHGITHRYAAFTESDSAPKVNDGDVMGLTGAESYAHWERLPFV
jgi:hypothetical protein